MIELALVLGILDKIAGTVLVLAQGASPEQKLAILDRHLALTKPLYDLLNKLPWNRGDHGLMPESTVTTTVQVPGLRPAPLPAPVTKS